jgi:septal ring factor EnvC (AmiA/AmiB activator)
MSKDSIKNITIVVLLVVVGVFIYYYRKPSGTVDITQNEEQIKRYNAQIDSIQKERNKTSDSMKALDKKDLVLLDSIKSASTRLASMDIQLKQSVEQLNSSKAIANIATQAYQKNEVSLIKSVRHPSNKVGDSLLQSLKNTFR